MTRSITVAYGGITVAYNSVLRLPKRYYGCLTSVLRLPNISITVAYNSVYQLPKRYTSCLHLLNNSVNV
ncbi:hypothetical protein GCM10028825_52520 [Spirosoma agri]